MKLIYVHITNYLFKYYVFQTVLGVDGGYLKIPRFVTSLDQIIYFSEGESSEPDLDGTIPDSAALTCCTNYRTAQIETDLMRKTGVLLSIRVQDSHTDKPESRMQVLSKCEFCKSSNQQYYTLLGDWQRNKTQFGKFFNEFDLYKKQSFNNYSLRIGYFNYFPHFMCVNGDDGVSLKKPQQVILPFQNHCLGIEWQIVNNLAKSLNFNFNLTNIGNDIENPTYKTNFSLMLNSLQMDVIDLAVGGITLTSERMAKIDFSQIFETEPIGNIEVLLYYETTIN